MNIKYLGRQNPLEPASYKKLPVTQRRRHLGPYKGKNWVKKFSQRTEMV
jgi:hypothetical protein